MSLFDRLLGRKPRATASIAKERLTMVLMRELPEGQANSPEESARLQQLQEEILAVVAKYYPVDADAIKVHLERKENVEILEVNITLNEHTGSG
ncbi:cell division topological specificity factor MinE [Hydrogenophilus thiooxidans]|uniref:cell division topological specificity factor MinE n=1 Tax=Hydrogenophilus thiooxidans TaxID=2820326 RepID=UPI002018338B|nr:cell division topological specificity factor MinE [Hydrogenophilus thiooxidans]